MSKNIHTHTHYGCKKISYRRIFRYRPIYRGKPDISDIVSGPEKDPKSLRKKNFPQKKTLKIFRLRRFLKKKKFFPKKRP